MPKKIEFTTTIQGAWGGLVLVVIVPKEEVDKVMWCHQGTAVNVAIKPIKKGG